MLTGIAMYNENAKEMKDTLTGVVKNLKTFKEQGIDPENMAAIIVVDGLKPFLSTYDKEDQ
jgi:hypothetical protein